eukprot:scaffold7066_cov253-Pinguiococcus_pyrenoidosus.AAC.28
MRNGSEILRSQRLQNQRGEALQLAQQRREVKELPWGAIGGRGASALQGLEGLDALEHHLDLFCKRQSVECQRGVFRHFGQLLRLLLHRAVQSRLPFRRLKQLKGLGKAQLSRLDGEHLPAALSSLTSSTRSASSALSTLARSSCSACSASWAS